MASLTGERERDLERRLLWRGGDADLDRLRCRRALRALCDRVSLPSVRTLRASDDGERSDRLSLSFRSPRGRLLGERVPLHSDCKCVEYLCVVHKRRPSLIRRHLL